MFCLDMKVINIELKTISDYLNIWPINLQPKLLYIGTLDSIVCK